MGTETKSNSYTGQISTSGGNPKVMKDSLSLVCQTVKQQQQQSNQINFNSNSNSNSNSKTFSSEQNAGDIRPKHEEKTTTTTTTITTTTTTITATATTPTTPTTVKEAIVPFVPIFVEEADVIQGAKDILKVIRPNWDLNHVDFKVN